MNILRRDYLKKIGITSVWLTPIVQSISLPAHAQTSNSLIYSQLNINPISVVVLPNQAIIRVRYFFDGGCPICGSEVEYQATANLLGSASNLEVSNFGCGTIAPDLLGTASITNYSFGDSDITVEINSTEVGNSIITIPLGGIADLGPFICS